MERLSWGRIAMVFAGAFLGAGYVSGQELFQFFGAFREMGYFGFLVAVLLMAFLGIVLVDYGRRTGITELDKAVVPNGPNWLRNLAGATQGIALFGIATVMFAGAGALLSQLFSLPEFVGCLLLTVLTFLVALFGLSGMIHTFSVLTPIVVLAAVGVSISAYVRFGPGVAFSLVPPEPDNPLLPNWFVAALTYAGCNLFSSVGIFLPLGIRVKTTKKAVLGVLVGAGLLAVIAYAILIAMSLYPYCTYTELPMVELAGAIFEPLSYAYGILLLFGMFGTGCASVIVLMEYLCAKLEPIQRHRTPFLLLICLLAFAGSLLGFGDLVGTVYPIFGYLSLLLFAPILFHYFRAGKTKE